MYQMNTKRSAGAYDWKKYPKGWKYTGTDDPKYIKDRNDLFNKNGNGWWLFVNQIMSKNKKR